jgi:hypothetical protein
VIEPQLRKLQAPTLIVWGTDDVYFPVKWAHWLAETIPGAKPPVELQGAGSSFRKNGRVSSIGWSATICWRPKATPLGGATGQRIACEAPEIVRIVRV